ncbi:phosphodiester glycosidase family protein [Cerasicoccus fimbriatus]|uniref:phosphodiester glycosidase family protein n=1 Tax=Cerasicoccus fimbriatus TaxID=3014554 RepID=UPI0022B33097|nr:phosphodiester glycosidase family protein [Cerasicoccus sp. TK19100]
MRTKTKLAIGGAFLCLTAAGLYLAQNQSPAAILRDARPKASDDSTVYIWQEPSPSGLGDFTTARIEISEASERFLLLVNPPGKNAPESANARLESPLNMARVGNFLVGINATSYTLPDKTPEETETWKTFLPGTDVTLRGFAKLTDGNQIGDERAAPDYPILWMSSDGIISLTNEPNPQDAVWAFSAYNWLVQDSAPYKAIRPYTNRKSRTAIGLSKDNRYLYLVVCGANRPSPIRESGASLPEIAEFLISLGVDRAFSMDGGSSTSMVLKTKDSYQLTPAPEKLISRPIPFMFGLSAQ